MRLTGKAADFLALHVPGKPLLQPNAFDIGSARILESLGFQAIATTSSGAAATIGRVDGSIGRDGTLAHCTAVAESVSIPVSGDTENGYADEPAAVAAFVTDATRTGVAGCSVEDWSGTATYELSLAAERVAAAAEAAHRGPTQVVLTARADGHFHGTDDLDSVIRRLQAYSAAGADVLFAPGFAALDDIRRIISETDKPVNVLVNVLVDDACPPLEQIAEAGAARISVGGSFAWVAYGAVIEAARELKESGTFSYSDKIRAARDAVRSVLR
jgi:2-methylisocitrate lyase-like PEP mutase family enzyme